MIRETELNLFVPSPELLVQLASGASPLGIKAGPPRIQVLRETYFDTPGQTLWNRGMTCKLRQVEGEHPSVVVTVGEGPDSEGITSRSRLTADAIGVGVFETLRGSSEPATQLKKFVDPGTLRPQIALDIQRLGRAHRRGVFRRAVLLLIFDRITVRVGGTSTVFHELRIRRRRSGGPQIRDLGQALRDQFHLFPDGLSTLQRARRILSMSGRGSELALSPFGLSLSLSLFRGGDLGMHRRGTSLNLPLFRGSGEDAARALLSDLTGDPDLSLLKLGSTEPREGRPVLEVWTAPGPMAPDVVDSATAKLEWYSWHRLLEEVGREDLNHPSLVSSLLLLTRRKLEGELPWILRPLPSHEPVRPPQAESETRQISAPELRCMGAFLPLLAEAENVEVPLKARLEAASQWSEKVSGFFRAELTTIKGRILSETDPADREEAVRLLDLISIRFRGMADRIYACLNEELLPALERSGIHLRAWSGLMNQDRKSILDHFSATYLPAMQVAPEWGPSFIPDMPPSGCAVGMLARTPGSDGTRFFHIVLGAETPSFVPLPGTKIVLPLEEVVRGYFLSENPSLEKAETCLFRFTTGEAIVREVVPEERVQEGPLESPFDEGEMSEAEWDLAPETGMLSQSVAKAEGDPDGSGGSAPPMQGPWSEEGIAESPTPESSTPQDAAPSSTFKETRFSFVVRVLAHRDMPELYQTQLLRALERQVSRRNPLIGWSDLHPLPGPLNLKGIQDLLDLGEG